MTAEEDSKRLPRGRCRMVGKGPIFATLIALLALGCATMRQECEYYPDGVLMESMARSTVVGKGETELVSLDCADLKYSTLDTGLSDNGRGAFKDVSEVVVDALVPTAGAGTLFEAFRERMDEGEDE